MRTAEGFPLKEHGNYRRREGLGWRQRGNPLNFRLAVTSPRPSIVSISPEGSGIGLPFASKNCMPWIAMLLLKECTSGSKPPPKFWEKATLDDNPNVI